MKLFDLVFELVKQNVPMKREDWAQMKKEMEADTDTWTHDDSNKLKSMYVKYNDHWGFRLVVACIYIPANRWIAKYMNPVLDEDEDE